MALQHASSGQVIALQHAGEDVTQFSSIALAKTDEIELIRLVLPAGKTMPEHWVKGEITLQCLSGEIAVDAHGRTATLHGGEMLYLAGATPHAVRAVADSVALLTIVLKD
ncbi:quercetin dioxygenase-like cupin family protein [Pseudoduganella flava]|uniref:Cupin domain-containing protein n=1 Tax=Pseudoduganella flava TaxID=871742 RepID=A0A562PP69_9BURK|nr:cupin domain-containing protein [Pseudoduganella flava]QGZ40670.1 cupin domain-containing protein [Pseudoduganella flava]TWI46123.1 quercetin dioxygenase-like cupin family protein [Pseudoduganella flava]